jgi:alpha-N-acetylglucosaminidase
LSRKIEELYEANNLENFKTLSDSFLLAIQCQDKLLATQKDFRVGNWLEQAKSLSHKQENRSLYEWNARTLITVWGNRLAAEKGGLHDYSNREWNGLLSDLYYLRWKLFFEHTIKEMQGENVAPIDFFEMEEKWAQEKKVYGSKSEGDVIKTATEVYSRMFGNSQVGI